MDAALEEAIQKLIEDINQKMAKHYHDSPFGLPTVKFVPLSDKWGKLVKVEKDLQDRDRECIYAFICLLDSSSNKSMGTVKRGDIHKAASYKTPAKHSRGSVFDPATWTACGPYGVAYIRGEGCCHNYICHSNFQ